MINKMNEREVVAKLRELGIHIHDDYCNFDSAKDIAEYIDNEWLIIDKEKK